MTVCFVVCSAHDNVVATLSGHTSWVLRVACSPDGTQFATGYVARVDYKAILYLKWISDCICRVAISGADRRVKIWDIGTRRCLTTFDTHTDQVNRHILYCY